MFAKLCAKRNKRGFTLAELLIVVAIIAVLVAISIPAFTSSLNKAKHAVDLSNMRAAYSEAVVDYMESADSTSPKTVTAKGLATTAGVTRSTVTWKSGEITVTYEGITGSFPTDDKVCTGEGT